MEGNNDFYALSSVYESISFFFERQKMLDSALFYARKHWKLHRKLISNTIAIETHQKLITGYLETAQKDLTIAEQTIVLKNRRITLIVTLSTSIVLIILLFFLFVNQQKRRKAIENRELTTKLEYEKEIQKIEKEKQKEALDAKAREITSYSLLVSNKNHLLNQIRELTAQIFNNQENAIKITTKIDDIILDNLTVDEEWENFKIHFDKVHPNSIVFSERLIPESLRSVL